MTEIMNKLKIQQTQQFERTLGIGNISSLIKCTGILFTEPCNKMLTHSHNFDDSVYSNEELILKPSG